MLPYRGPVAKQDRNALCVLLRKELKKYYADMGNFDPSENGDVLTRDDVKSERKSATKEPDMYKVVLLNDDYTTMEFVILILEKVFRKSPGDATDIMLSVHQKGAGIAGVYTKDVAETKIALVHQMARQNEFPLRCVIEST